MANNSSKSALRKFQDSLMAELARVQPEAGIRPARFKGEFLMAERSGTITVRVERFQTEFTRVRCRDRHELTLLTASLQEFVPAVATWLLLVRDLESVVYRWDETAAASLPLETQQTLKAMGLVEDARLVGPGQVSALFWQSISSSRDREAGHHAAQRHPEAASEQSRRLECFAALTDLLTSDSPERSGA